MLIIDHGNICVDTIFKINIMHSFPDIEENLFFDNGGPQLHTHNMHIHKTTFCDHENISVGTLLR